MKQDWISQHGSSGHRMARIRMKDAQSATASRNVCTAVPQCQQPKPAAKAEASNGNSCPRMLLFKCCDLVSMLLCK